MLIKALADYYALSLLSGLELSNALYHLYLQNNFYIENKQIKPALKLEQNDGLNEPSFMGFKSFHYNFRNDSLQEKGNNASPNSY